MGLKRFFVRIGSEFYSLLKKEYLLLLRRRKYLMLALAFPLLLSIIYLFVLSPKPTTFEIGVCDFDQTPETTAMLNNIQDFKVNILNGNLCLEELQERIKKGEFLLGIEIPNGFSHELNNLRPAQLITYKDNSDPSLANFVEWRLNDALAVHKKTLIGEANNQFKKEVAGLNTQVKTILKFVEYVDSSTLRPISSDLSDAEDSLTKLENLDTNFLSNPIYLESRGVYNIKNDVSTGLTFIFPIIALFVLLLVVSTNIIYDKKTGFLSRVKASRTSSFMYLLAKIVFFFALTLLQFIVVLIVFFIGGATFSVHILGLLQVIIVIAVVDTLMAIIVGLVSESEGIAVLISLLLTMPFMFLSGIFYPMKIMPGFLQWLAYVFPLNNQIFLMKKVMLFNQTIFAESFYLAIALFIITWFLTQKK